VCLLCWWSALRIELVVEYFSLGCCSFQSWSTRCFVRVVDDLSEVLWSMTCCSRKI